MTLPSSREAGRWNWAEYPAQFQRPASLEEGRVIHRQQCEIAIVGDELHACPVGMAQVLTRQGDEPRITDHMGVGEDSFSVAGGIDHETRSDPPADMTRVPGRTVVGFLIRQLDPDNTVREIGRSGGSSREAFRILGSSVWACNEEKCQTG